VRAERIARQREGDEAAKAALFFRGTGTDRSAREERTGPNAISSASRVAVTDSAPATSSSTDKPDAKQRFLDHQASLPSVSEHALQLAASPYLISAGSVIAAALITGVNSDLPGLVLATVTEAVFDSASGRHLLIPQGSRLIGQYDSQVAFGQRRVLMVWNRLILPDATSIALDRLPGVDTGGYAGLEDQVDWHWGQILAGAALSTLVGVGAELAAPDRANGQSEVIVASRQSLQESINQAGQELTRRRLDVAPTLTVRPGFPVRAIVNRDLVLRPYQPLFVE
jgi:type IV secretion system protein VirB10